MSVPGDTGQGQLASFGGTSFSNIQDISMDNTGEVLREVVADGIVSVVIGTGWEWTVQFIAPRSATHTLESGMKAGTEGAIDITTGATRYTNANGRSLGFTKRSGSKALIIYSLRLTTDNDPTLAAKA